MNKKKILCIMLIALIIVAVVIIICNCNKNENKDNSDTTYSQTNQEESKDNDNTTQSQTNQPEGVKLSTIEDNDNIKLPDTSEEDTVTDFTSTISDDDEDVIHSSATK